MLCGALSEFVHKVGKDKSILAVDVGSKTLGVAVSDRTQLIATALTTLIRRKLTADLEALLKLMEGYQIGGIVIGFPLHTSGAIGKSAQSTRQFAYHVARATHLPVILWDERYTTFAADNVLLEANMSRAKRKEVVDKVAASIILQHALDSMRAS